MASWIVEVISNPNKRLNVDEFMCWDILNRHEFIFKNFNNAVEFTKDCMKEFKNIDFVITSVNKQKPIKRKKK